MKAQIGLLRHEDVERAARIDHDAFGEGGDEATRIRNLAEEIARPWARVTAAKEGGGAVGFLIAWIVADEVHLHNVAVLQGHRRKGIGRQLVVDLIDHANQKGARTVFLEVRIGNAAAIALYQSLGFETLSRREKYYSDGEDALDMALVLGGEPKEGVR